MIEGGIKVDDRVWEDLRRAAEDVRAHAHVPYSGFAVGAALLGDDGRIYSGCNVENASYGLTICAERAAVANMVGAGGRAIAAVFVVADADRPVPPCGACRQVLQEFAPARAPLRMANLQGAVQDASLGQLLPFAFSKEDLDS